MSERGSSGRQLPPDPRQARGGVPAGDGPPPSGTGALLPGLATGLAQARSEQQTARLLETFGQGTKELRRELREFIRKQDYRFQHEGLTTAEASAWKRAVYRMVGEPPPRRRPER